MGSLKGSKQINAAQESPQSALPRALGVAIRTFDAWMLADEKALTDVLGCQIDKQPDPESISDPKQQCVGLLAGGPNRMVQSEIYAKVSECLDLNILRSRCKEGFAPFAQRTEGIFQHAE